MTTKFHQQLKQAQKRDRQSGATLIEMVVVIAVMAIVSTAIFSILVTTLSSYRKLDNETSSVQVVRNAIERIGKDVRMARSLGDIFGTTDRTIYPDDTNNPMTVGYIWPTWSDGSAPSSFTLSSDTLIIQVPIFDTNGFPLQVNDLAAEPQSNVETHIYRVLHRASDPAGEYVLEYMAVPGTTMSTYDATTAERKPRIIATGIIGPLVSGNPVPRVFQYIDINQNTVDNVFPTPGNLNDFTTIGINLEVRKHEATQQVGGQWRDAGIWAVKQEVYMRNNVYATPSNNGS
ncbi:MAG: prepilin-type N-terminal cleavage/methylation domain-containing protein [Candidatus Obscuribacterales bacterium]|nr:prepilin-type N-terminal cleavage/methylation domain-containing protein [Candidatus Obscuribacterales bacterium]